MENKKNKTCQNWWNEQEKKIIEKACHTFCKVCHKTKEKEICTHECSEFTNFCLEMEHKQNAKIEHPEQGEF